MVQDTGFIYCYAKEVDPVIVQSHRGGPGGFTLPTLNLMMAPRLSLGPDASLADVYHRGSLGGFRV